MLKAPLTVAQWDKQKRVLASPASHGIVELGFATFFLNRTNRSGILNGGIIGGRDQTGPWKIDARYNAKELVRRIEAIAAFRSRIKLTKSDALTFLRKGITKWPADTLIYLDPPYYVKGRDLYDDFYQPEDHGDIATFMRNSNLKQRWIVSYDNVEPIRELYEGFRRVIYSIGYSARKSSMGSEVMFFADGLKVPPLVGPVQITEDRASELRKLA